MLLLMMFPTSVESLGSKMQYSYRANCNLAVTVKDALICKSFIMSLIMSGMKFTFLLTCIHNERHLVSV